MNTKHLSFHEKKTGIVKEIPGVQKSYGGPSAPDPPGGPSGPRSPGGPRGPPGPGSPRPPDSPG